MPNPLNMALGFADECGLIVACPSINALIFLHFKHLLGCSCRQDLAPGPDKLDIELRKLTVKEKFQSR